MFTVSVNNESQLKVALFKTRNFCLEHHINQVNTSKITTAASELLRNVLKYANSGKLQIKTYQNEGQQGIELSISDKGPGIKDVNQAMQDNYSSSGTLGLGLPGVERLMDYFCLQSEPNQGTKVTVRKYQ